MAIWHQTEPKLLTVGGSDKGWDYLPDPPDYRDHEAHFLLGEGYPSGVLPSKVMLAVDYVIEIQDQETLGSCVANAGFTAIQIKQYLQDGKHHPLGARLYGYYLARSYSGMEKYDSGTHIRDFFRAINKYGFPPEETYAHGYNVEKFNKPPTPLSYFNAFDQKEPTLYRRIMKTDWRRVDQCKLSLVNGNPVVFGCLVTTDFTHNVGTDKIVNPPKPGETIAGGHAMVAVGYDDEEQAFWVVNSWGTKFGILGFCSMSYEYAKQWIDVWEVVEAPNYSYFAEKIR